jgi:hypothetical protein
MLRKKRLQKASKPFADDDLHAVLLSGRAYFLGRMDRPSFEELAAYWREHRDELLREWHEKQPPGSRPFGSWLCELIPEYGERPIIDLPQDFEREGHELFGVLHLPDSMGVQMYEHQFLYHHGLIDEQEFLAAEAYWDDILGDDEDEV